MDYSTDSPVGQPFVRVDQVLVEQIAHVCDIMQMLRAWWDHFESSLSQVNQVAAIKGYDLMIEGATTSRFIARTLGVPLPAVESLSWDVSPRPDPDVASSF